MHSKAKGNIGEMAVAKDLMLKGYAVFTELGDLSHVDLIAIKDSSIKKVQVKTKWDTSKGTITADTRSTGQYYEYRYSSNEVDVLALYAADRDDVYYVPIEVIENEEKRSFTLRIDKPKNNQTKGVRLAEDYRVV